MASPKDSDPGESEARRSAIAAAAALETWRGPQGEGADGSTATVPALSILYHSDLGRVGEQLVLHELGSAKGVLLSRTGPDFISRYRDAGRPLADRNLSRSPVRLSALPEGGIRIDMGECRTPVTVRGERLRGAIDLSAAEVRRGVVVELARRIVLLVHQVVTAASTGVFITVADDPVSADLLGDSEGMRRLRQDIRRVADLDVPVLVRGETGSGKELVARAIHRASARRDAPFVAVNLGAVSAQLAVAELFGHEKGAFTGADRRRSGYFHQADGGTLFLDEIGEAPPEIQVALLRALETGEIQAVGSAQKQKVDVRIVAATDADLEAKIGDGHFRAPLLHRLASYEIWVPPLRERRDDIGRLLVHFLREGLAQTREEHRIASPPDTGDLWFPAPLVAKMVDFDWPGNVRQLGNVMRQILIGSRGRTQAVVGPAVERQLQGAGAPQRISALPADVAPPPSSTRERAVAPQDTGPETPSVSRRKPADIGESELENALRASRWDLAKAAAVLGIARASLYALVEASASLRTAGALTPEEITRAFHECDGDVDRMVDRLEVSERALRRRLRDLGLPDRGPAAEAVAKPKPSAPDPPTEPRPEGSGPRPSSVAE